MKQKFAFFLLCLLLPLCCGCGKEKQSGNITFTATVEEVHENSLTVSTSDDVGFDSAVVNFDAKSRPGFEPVPGRRVRITILPKISESYPVQVTAVSIDQLN